MGAVLLAAMPAHAQQVQCFDSDEIFKLTQKTDGLEAERIEGKKFQSFMDETIAKFGPYPDAEMPDHAIIMYAAKIPTARVYFVNADGKTCRMITISAKQADSIIKAVFGRPV